MHKHDSTKSIRAPQVRAYPVEVSVYDYFLHRINQLPPEELRLLELYLVYRETLDHVRGDK